jgi:cytochrome P450
MPSLLNPAGRYAEQMQTPVIFDPNFVTYFGVKGTWQIFNYALVKKVLSDPKVFSNQYTPRIASNPLMNNLNQQDPPQHTRLRLFLAKTFNPSFVEDLAPYINSITEELCQQMKDRKEVNFMTSFANKLPSNVISRALGITDTSYDQVMKWVEQIAAVPTPDTVASYYNCQQEIMTFLQNQVRNKVEHPDDGLISRWISYDINGEKLSTEEVVLFCMNLYLGGSGTLSGLLGFAVFALTEYPELQSFLYNEPQNVPNFIDEVLRLYAPVPTMYRITTDDVELDGQYIKKGDIITVWLGAANRDPLVFDEPNEFKLHRSNIAQSMSLGYGPHFCIGSHLVRLEASIVIDLLLRHFQNICIKTETAPVLSDSLLASSFTNLIINYSHRN